jgi:hypothetical protein
MENTKAGRTDCHMQLTEPTDSKDSGYRLQGFIEFALNVTLWWCKWAIRKGIAFMCFVLRHVLIVSDNIQRVALAPANSGTFAGVTATVSGWGWTQGKYVDPFNSYSTDKEMLLYSQCHMDLIESKQKYAI